MQKITVTGNLGRDPETRYTNNGKENMKFTVGVSKWLPGQAGEDGRRETEWYNVTVWSPSDYLKENLASGAHVLVTGDFLRREYQKKDGGTGQSMDITVNGRDVEIMRPPRDRSNDGGESRQPAAAGRNGGKRQSSVENLDIDDLPF